MKHKKICIITPYYPTRDNPTIYTFVDQLACSMADDGNEILVICPQSYYDAIRYNNERTIEKRTINNNRIIVYRPLMMSYGKKKLPYFNSMTLTYSSFRRSVERVLISKGKNVDYLYGHFLSPAGLCVAELGKKYLIPSFCAFGESSLWSIDYTSIERIKEKLALLNGIIAVSSYNREILLENSLYDSERIEVIPNGCNSKLFFPRDKDESRDILKLPKDVMIGIFVGKFDERKGSERVDAATNGIEKLKMMYIGSGKRIPKGDNIIFCGKIDHDKLPIYLSASDFFILPTKAEGCCNAIIEAMFCGLPIISSSGKYNDDILTTGNSIRIDPENISQMKCAVKKLLNNRTLREQMSLNSIRQAKQLRIDIRARRIIKFMEKYSDK